MAVEPKGHPRYGRSYPETQYLRAKADEMLNQVDGPLGDFRTLATFAVEYLQEFEHGSAEPAALTQSLGEPLSRAEQLDIMENVLEDFLRYVHTTAFK